MTYSENALRHFLRSFESYSASGDGSVGAKQFAEHFLVVSPQGSQCVRAVDFAAALPKRKELFDSFGFQSSELIGCKEVALGEQYVLAHTNWRFNFARVVERPEVIEVQSTFVVDVGVEPYKVIFYLAHQNIIEILKQRSSTAPA